MAADKKYAKKGKLFGLFNKSSENSYSNSPSSKPVKTSSRPNTRTKKMEDINIKSVTPAKEIKANPSSLLLSMDGAKKVEDEFSITKIASEAQNIAAGVDLEAQDSNNENFSNLKIAKDSKLFKKNLPISENTIAEEKNDEQLSIDEEQVSTKTPEISIEEITEELKNYNPDEADTSYLLLSKQEKNKSKNRIKGEEQEATVRVGTLDEISKEREPKKKTAWTFTLSPTSMVMATGAGLITLGFFFVFGLVVGKGLSPEATPMPLASIVPDNENVVIEQANETLKPEELEYAKVLKTVPVKEEVVDPNTVFLGEDGKPLPAGTYIVGPDGKLLPETTIILGADGKPIPVNTVVLGEEGKAISQNVVVAVDPQVPYPIGKVEEVTPVASEEAKTIIEPVIEEPKLYDYVLRAASFKDEKLADNLRASLEGDGLRTQLVKSKSWYMVNIKYRGTDENYQKLRAGLKKHKISDSVTVSKVEIETKK